MKVYVFVFEIFYEDKHLFYLRLVVAHKFEVSINLSAQGLNVVVAVFHADEVFELNEFGLVQITVFPLLADNCVDVFYD